jgi:transposase-like protein
MVYYAMPLIMKSESGASTQQQQLCLNPNQMVVSESNYNGQLPLQPQQAQLINLSNGDVNGSSPSQQNNYTYQLLTSNDHQMQNQHHNGNAPTSSHRTPKSTKSFKCEQCNMTFTTKSAHTSHIKSHAKQQNGLQPSASLKNGNGSQQMQSSDPYQCDVCQKTFAVPARLVSSNI